MKSADIARRPPARVFLFPISVGCASGAAEASDMDVTRLQAECDFWDALDVAGLPAALPSSV